jgi:phosphodiesterase/alkaline phosphatase D-like protein
MERNPANWQAGSARTGVRFALYGSTAAACTVQLFTTRNRSTLHADTNNAGRQACNRTSSLVEGDTVTFVFGAESPLTPLTTYFYRITDGTRVMVGEFQTAPAGPDTVRRVQMPVADTLSYSANPDMSGATALPAATAHSIPMASGSVIYWRAGSAGHRSVFIAP